jgi:putative methyltransferase (TIGR04325 family)
MPGIQLRRRLFRAVAGVAPSLFVRAVQRVRGRHGWFGDYPDWQTASAAAGGYDTPGIADRVEAAALRVRNGDAAFERDGVAFEELELDWNVLCGVLLSAARNDGQLHVLDFGGSLGSTFFQHRSVLAKLRSVRWCVVEQDELVTRGTRHFASDELVFYRTIDECFRRETPAALLLGSVLQYLPDPYGMLRMLLSYPFDTVIIHRTAFVAGGGERITVQRVPSWIYSASYPSWFLNTSRFEAAFAPAYSKVTDWTCSDWSNLSDTYFKGYLYSRTHAPSAKC